MNSDFFSSTFIRSSYRNTAARNGILVVLGYAICGAYLLTARKRTAQFKKLENSLTFTVQTVLFLTSPQCLLYLFIAAVVRTDFPISIGLCSIFKNFFTYAAQSAYIIPATIAFCRYLELVWAINFSRLTIALIIVLLCCPQRRRNKECSQIGLAISFTVFGFPTNNDICAQFLAYQSSSVPTIVHFYIFLIQPVGIGFQMYNLYYLRRIMRRLSQGGKGRSRLGMTPRVKSHILDGNLTEYHATIGMICHHLVMLASICLKFVLAIILIDNKASVTYSALLKIIDLLPYTMPSFVGLISIMCISDSRDAIASFFRLKKINCQKRTNTVPLTTYA